MCLLLKHHNIVSGRDKKSGESFSLHIYHVCFPYITRLKNDLLLRVMQGHEWPDCQ